MDNMVKEMRDENYIDIKRREWKRWLFLICIIGIITMSFVGARLWRDYLGLFGGAFIGFVISAVNMLFAYLSRKKSNGMYLMVCIITLSFTAEFSRITFELKAGQMGQVTGMIIGVLLYCIPIFLGLVIGFREPMILHVKKDKELGDGTFDK